MKGRSRSFLRHLAISFLSLFATLSLLEVGIRLVVPQDLAFFDSHSFRRLLPTSPHFVENIPNRTAVFSGVPVSINSVGLRDSEVVLPKPPRTIRMIAVGDSVTFGYGIPIEATYPKVLQRRLNGISASQNNSSEAPHFEVLNAGTLGGSLGDYLHFLNQKTDLLQPDVILLGLTLNDILVYSDAGGVVENGAEFQGEHQSRLRRVSQLLLRHSQLYALSYSRVKSILYSAGVFDMNKVQGSNFLAVAPPSPYQEKAWQSSLAMLSRIADFCHQRNLGLFIIVFPMEMQLSTQQFDFYQKIYRLRLGEGTLAADPQRRLHHYAAANGLNLIDPLPAFRAHAHEGLYLRNKMIPSDPTHPSILGNELIANEIFGALVPALK
jgi:lysophospholipase L1-like esterase